MMAYLSLNCQSSHLSGYYLRRERKVKVFTNPVKLCRSSRLQSLTTHTKGDGEMQKVTDYLSWGDEEESSEGLLDAESDAICSLSSTQRIYAFAACLGSGLILMFLSIVVFAKPIKFAVLFTLGNVLAVGSTAFLMGFERQLRMMFDSTRIYATAIYIGFVVFSLICALWIHNKILTVISIICEICALVWYSLSYIPFARRIVSELMIRFCDTEL